MLACLLEVVFNVSSPSSMPDVSFTDKPSVNLTWYLIVRPSIALALRGAVLLCAPIAATEQLSQPAL